MGGLLVVCLSLSAQQSVTVHGPEFVTAGESLTLVITIDRAPNFKGSSILLTVQSPALSGAGYQIGLVPGKTEYQLEVPIPEGAKGGTWRVTGVRFMTGAGENWVLPSTDYGFQVIPKKGLVYPSSAEIGMRPSQTQLLRTEALRLQAQIQDLKGQILEHRSDTKLLGLLRQSVITAIEALNGTEQEFTKLDNTSKSEEGARVFFGDLRTTYREADHELKAADNGRRHNLLLLAAAPQAKNEPSAYPLLAQAVLRAFEQNELAYNAVADAQSLTFSLEVSSVPKGATISYRRRGDDFKQASAPTDSTINALVFAIWIVRFEKSGFLTMEREHDPFREPNHVIHVELMKAN